MLVIKCLDSLALNLSFNVYVVFLNSTAVFDRFHLVTLVCDAMQHLRTAL
jgi:hypothetical protein